MLGHLLPYADTVFNHRQVSTLLEEVLRLLGVPSRAVMDVMGWSHIGMTTRYQHITSELTVSIADQIGGLLWASDGQEDEDEAEHP